MRRFGFLALLLLTVLGTSTCGPPGLTPLRTKVKASFGQELVRTVAYKGDSTHLLIQLDSAAFGEMSDTAILAKARAIGRFAAIHHPAIDVVDSITVSVGQTVVKNGLFRVTASVRGALSDYVRGTARELELTVTGRHPL